VAIFYGRRTGKRRDPNSPIVPYQRIPAVNPDIIRLEEEVKDGMQKYNPRCSCKNMGEV
jgi:hypothetical protein